MTNLLGFFKKEMSKDEEERKAKSSFWASECETPLFDLYHRWLGTKPTNQPDLSSLMMMNTGKMLELSLLKLLQENGMAVQIDEQTRVEFDLPEYKIKVSGYIDAILSDGSPLEIKTFYGDYQERELEMGKARTSYLKQLAVYMYYLDVPQGTLLYVNRGSGKMFQFTLLKEGKTSFYLVKRSDEFGEIIEKEFVFELSETFNRWSLLYHNNILPKVEPKSEYRYKIPLSEIDWNKISKTDIAKARNNQKVIGDHPWAIQYSSFKDLIVEREGCGLGYTDEELAIIKAETAGYTSIKK